MKFKIARSKFLDSLKKVQNIVGSKGSMMILQNVLLEANDRQLFLTTTDLDISIRSVVPCEVEAEGSTTLPAKVLFNAVSKAAEGMIEVEVDGEDRAQITAGSAFYKLSGMSVVDFPTLPQDQNSFEYVIPQIALRDMLRKTAYAASQDDTRKTLKGVLMSFRDGKVTMVATDGRRLALIEGDARITIEKSQVSFNLGDTRLYSKLLDEIYPNYRQVIPGELSERVSVDRELLLAALDRVSVMKKDESNSTKLTFNANELIVSSSVTEAGSARDIVPIKYDGPMIDIVFNPGFVMDPLRAIDEDEIIIELSNGHSPALIKCSVPFLYVMMPLRIS